MGNYLGTVCAANAYCFWVTCSYVFVGCNCPWRGSCDAQLSTTVSSTSLSFQWARVYWTVGRVRILEECSPRTYTLCCRCRIECQRRVAGYRTCCWKRGQAWTCTLSDPVVIMGNCLITICATDANCLNITCSDVSVCSDCPWSCNCNAQLSSTVSSTSLSFQWARSNGAIGGIWILEECGPRTDASSGCSWIVC